MDKFLFFSYFLQMMIGVLQPGNGFLLTNIVIFFFLRLPSKSFAFGNTSKVKEKAGFSVHYKILKKIIFSS